MSKSFHCRWIKHWCTFCLYRFTKKGLQFVHKRRHLCDEIWLQSCCI